MGHGKQEDIHSQKKAGGSEKKTNPKNPDQDMEVSEIGKPVINKKIPRDAPGIDTGRWAD